MASEAAKQLRLLLRHTRNVDNVKHYIQNFFRGEAPEKHPAAQRFAVDFVAYVQELKVQDKLIKDYTGEKTTQKKRIQNTATLVGLGMPKIKPMPECVSALWASLVTWVLHRCRCCVCAGNRVVLVLFARLPARVTLRRPIWRVPATHFVFEHQQAAVTTRAATRRRTADPRRGTPDGRAGVCCIY
jgi:hypothetical protein